MEENKKKSLLLRGSKCFNFGLGLFRNVKVRDLQGNEITKSQHDFKRILVNGVKRYHDDPENPEYQKIYFECLLKEDPDWVFEHDPKFTNQELKLWYGEDYKPDIEAPFKAGDNIPLEFVIWRIWSQEGVRTMIKEGLFQIKATQDTAEGIKKALRAAKMTNEDSLLARSIFGNRALVGLSTVGGQTSGLADEERKELTGLAEVAQAKADEEARKRAEVESKLADMQENIAALGDLKKELDTFKQEKADVEKEKAELEKLKKENDKLAKANEKLKKASREGEK